jgi:hypothetical protein
VRPRTGGEDVYYGGRECAQAWYSPNMSLTNSLNNPIVYGESTNVARSSRRGKGCRDVLRWLVSFLF